MLSIAQVRGGAGKSEIMEVLETGSPTRAKYDKLGKTKVFEYTAFDQAEGTLKKDRGVLCRRGGCHLDHNCICFLWHMGDLR
jgi:hypothetical protein